MSCSMLESHLEEFNTDRWIFEECTHKNGGSSREELILKISAEDKNGGRETGATELGEGQRRSMCLLSINQFANPGGIVQL